MESFVFGGLPVRVVFGAGAFDALPAELDRLGTRRVLLIATPSQASQAGRIASALGARLVARETHIIQHVPAEQMEATAALAARVGADCLVALGGGSAIGLAKAVALRTALPIVAIPSTYSGSEMTPIYGISEGGAKRTGRDASVLAKTVLYDPDLTLGLPPHLSAMSGLNAIAHAVEGLYAEDANPLTSIFAEEGIRALGRGLPRVVECPDDRAARADCLYGAFLCGAVLGGVGMSLHHKLCHTLGGSFGLPHAETHAVVLPQVVAFNAPAVPAAMARVAVALGSAEAASGIHALGARLGVPAGLRALGLRREDLDRAAALATENPYFNPRPFDRHDVRAVLEAAWEGRPPGPG